MPSGNTENGQHQSLHNAIGSLGENARDITESSQEMFLMAQMSASSRKPQTSTLKKRFKRLDSKYEVWGIPGIP